MPLFNCQIMDASGEVDQRNITAPSIIEIHRLLDQRNERLIKAVKKSSLNLEMNIDPYLKKIYLYSLREVFVNQNIKYCYIKQLKYHL